MNETIFQQVPEYLADTLGVSSSVVTGFLFVTIALFFSFVLLRATGSVLLGLLASGGTVIAGIVLGMLPLWTMVIAGFGIATYIGYHLFLRSEDSPSPSIDFSSPPKRTSSLNRIIFRVEKSSSKWEQYINNLDDLLGIQTVEAVSVPPGLRLDTDRTLWISTAYDWYISDKDPDRNIFKVVGFHKEDFDKNEVYLLGETAGSPFLVRVDSVYLEGDVEECLIWANRKNCLPWLGGVTTGVSTIAGIVPIVLAACIIVGATAWISTQ